MIPPVNVWVGSLSKSVRSARVDDERIQLRPIASLNAWSSLKNANVGFEGHVRMDIETGELIQHEWERIQR